MAKSFIKLLQEKKGFLAAVYATLIVQLVLTFIIIYKFRDHPTLSKATKQSFILYLVLSIGIILLINFVKMPIWVKFILLTAFSVVTGAMLHNASVKLPESYITQALTGTIGVFIGLSILAFMLAAVGIDLGFLAIYILAALIGLLVAQLILRFQDKTEKTSKIRKMLLIIGLIIFSIYIMFCTNIMLQKNYGSDFISASLDLYLGFINTFTSILALES
jgi:FtsH-binding integral membrane protein